MAKKGRTNVSAQGQQPQAGQQAQQHDPQHLQAAAQFGQALQQHGVQAATAAGVFGWLTRHLPTILGMIQDLAGQAGGGGQPAAQAGQPPGAQAAGS
jgi:hypothetical protein